MRPEVAARITKAIGSFTASQGAEALVDPALRAQFNASLPAAALQAIRWYPAIPSGLEEIEGRILDRVKAAD
jgi:spermidine/putrescine transport system substrate-binding protein